MTFRLLVALILMGVLAYGGVQLPLIAIQELMERGDLDGAMHAIADALEKRPNDPGILNLRGVVHARRAELAPARDDFAQAVKIDASLTPAWQNLARACQQLDQRECSIDAWQHVLQLKPADPEAHISLAQIDTEKQDFAGALRHLNAAKTEN